MAPAAVVLSLTSAGGTGRSSRSQRAGHELLTPDIEANLALTSSEGQDVRLTGV